MWRQMRPVFADARGRLLTLTLGRNNRAAPKGPGQRLDPGRPGLPETTLPYGPDQPAQPLQAGPSHAGTLIGQAGLPGQHDPGGQAAGSAVG
jgi:hypothetical protein